MTDLTTRARELCEGGVNPELVRTVYELCEALEKANAEIERLKASEDINANIINALKEALIKIRDSSNWAPVKKYCSEVLQFLFPAPPANGGGKE